LCGCGGFRIATGLQRAAIVFFVCNVSKRLFGCGRCVFATCAAYGHVESGKVWMWRHVSFSLICQMEEGKAAKKAAKGA
jgi:hypothetical protein